MNSNNNSFFSGALKLGAGQFLAQLLFVASAPLLTRVYDPELFGLALTFYAIAVLIGIGASLRFDIAIVLASRNGDAALLFWAATVFAAAFCLALEFLAWLAAAAGVNVSAYHPALTYATLLPIAGFLYALQLLAAAMANRRRRYALMGQALVLGSVATITYALVAGWGGVPGDGLIVARTLGIGVAAAILTAGAGRLIAEGFPQTTAAVTKAIVANRRYALLNVPYSAFEALAREWFAIIALAFGRIELAGYFVLIRLIMVTPISLVSTAMSEVFFRDSVDMISAPELERRSRLLWIGIGGCVAPFLAVVPFHGSELFAFAFGEAWRPAGMLAAYYAPVVLMVAYTGFPARLYEVTARQSLSLRIITVFLLIKGVVLTLVFAYGANDIVTIVANSIIDFAYHLSYLAGLVLVAGFRPKHVVTAIAGNPILLAVLSAAFSAGAATLMGYGLSSALLSVLGACVIAAAGLLALRKQWRE